MRLTNRRQKIAIVVAILALVALSMVPPWRYLDGRTAGFHPLFAPPPALPDSTHTGKVQEEYTPIRIVPLAMFNLEKKSEFTPEEMRRPYVDVRKMLTISGVLFFAAILFVILLRDWKKRAEMSPEQETALKQL